MTILESIYKAVTEGKVDDAAQGVEQALEAGVQVDEILNKGLVAAMDVVGERFAEGDLFIPQVLWSAKAMQAGMELLSAHFSVQGQGLRGTVVIGTVKGDIHDIGKNLVAMMLGASFRVVDLGVDVAPETFVERAAAEKAQVLGMSALLTTTMQSMAEVVELLKEHNLGEMRVIVGGAPVSQSFCEEIGAHAYGLDAMDAVQKVRDLAATGK